MSYRNKAVEYRRGLWRLAGNALDDSGYGNDGTLVNVPTWALTPWGSGCIELDGATKHVSLGDLEYLNAVSSYTMSFWMNQSVIDSEDIVFRKRLDALNEGRIITRAGGNMDFIVDNNGDNRGSFDYSTRIFAQSWHHVSMVYDGSQTGNANRLVVYVDGAPITLAFIGTIPAVTADLTGTDATIGAALASFDGKIADFQIHSIPLTRDEVYAVMRGR